MSYLFGGTPFDGYARDGRRSLNGGGGGGIISAIVDVVAVADHIGFASHRYLAELVIFAGFQLQIAFF